MRDREEIAGDYRHSSGYTTTKWLMLEVFLDIRDLIKELIETKGKEHK